MTHVITTRSILGIGLGLGCLLGCSSTRQEKPPQAEPGDWEVRLESPLDTVVVATDQSGATEMVETTGTPILETPVVTETAPAAGAGVASTSGAGGAAVTGAGATTSAAKPASQPAPSPAAPAGAQAFTPGWRVQLFASSSMVSADALATRARRQFSEPVYVVYEPPLYKVRLGDFLSKEDARHMSNRAKAENFEAWVVEDLVLRPTR